MATRYWVGGTGTWDASSTTNWSATSGGASGASAPTSADSVIFNTAGGGGTVTWSGSIAASNVTLGAQSHDLGSSSLTVSGTGLTCALGFGLSVTAGTSTITFTGTSQQYFAGQGKTWGNVVFNCSTLGAYPYINEVGNTFASLSITNLTEVMFDFPSGTQTITGSLTISAVSYITRANIAARTLGSSTQFIVGASSSFTNINVANVTVTGTGAPIATTSVGNMGNCSGINFSASKTCYWVGGTGNWNDLAGTHWAISSGGGGSVANYPLAHDDVVFNSASGSANYTVTNNINIAYCRNLTISAPSSGNLTLIGTSFTQLAVFGNVTLYSGLITTATMYLSFESYGGTQTLTTNGVTILWMLYGVLGNFPSNSPTISLQDTLRVTGDVYFYNRSTLVTNNNNIIVSASLTISACTLGSSNITVGTGITFAATTLSNVQNYNTAVINFATNCTIEYAATPVFGTCVFQSSSTDPTFNPSSNGTTIPVPKIIWSGSGTFWIYNGTYAEVMVTGGGSLALPTSGAPAEVRKITGGSQARKTKVISDTSGTQAIITQSTGSATITYADIKDVSFTGGIVVTAQNCINRANNSGITFVETAPIDYSNFPPARRT
jgi:hypothetical protein